MTRKPFDRNAVERVARAALRRMGALSGVAWRCESGVSAVEFGLFAPILFIGLVTTADLGLALSERMAIDHTLRAAAQIAMTDPGADKVLSVLRATAAQDFVVASTELDADAGALTVSVLRVCACSGAPETGFDCQLTCPDGGQRFAFYEIEAAKKYDAMILSPEILGRLEASLRVQVQ